MVCLNCPRYVVNFCPLVVSEGHHVSRRLGARKDNHPVFVFPTVGSITTSPRRLFPHHPPWLLPRPFPFAPPPLHLLFLPLFLPLYLPPPYLLPPLLPLSPLLFRPPPCPPVLLL